MFRRSTILAAMVLLGSIQLSPAADKAAIDAAIKKGGEYLQKQYSGQGNASRGGGGHEAGSGATSLSGLAMLEAGIPKDDPAVVNVTNAVRNACLAEGGTYHIALAIIYLDRHGDPTDLPVIQMLGVRLNAGLTSSGGWGYTSWADTAGADRLLQTLRAGSLTNTKPEGKDKNKDDGFLKADDGKAITTVTTKLNPDVQKVWNAVANTIRTSGRTAQPGDNSNTQFGVVGLWVASRSGVPCKEAFALIEQRFIRSQSPVDGGWQYTSGLGGGMDGGGGKSTMAMTCAGLLGVAIGKAGRNVLHTGDAKPDVRKPDPTDDGFAEPGAGKPASGKKPAENLAANGKSAEAGLKALAGAFNGIARGGNVTQFIGLGNSLYTLWSLERVCVAYNLDTLGGQDWHSVGADVILPMQGADGAVKDTSYGDDVNTSFAVLFLAKANFTRGLGTKVRDPGKAELRGGGANVPPPLSAPAQANPNAGGKKPGAANPDIPTNAGFSLPTIAQPTEETEAEKVAAELVAAVAENDWKVKLQQALSSKGGKWTRGLTLACARLDGERRYQARDSLAERLTRMTALTLDNMLKNPEAELRRAACLAIAMKEDTAMLPQLISKLKDPNEFVGRAAHAALKSFAPLGTDYGPKSNADDAAKDQAVEAWAAWYEKSATKK